MQPILDERQTATLQRIIQPDAANVFVAYWKMGRGKTRLALMAFDQSGYEDLIFITRRVAFGDMIKEIEKCRLDYSVYLDDYDIRSCVRLGDTKNFRRVLFVSAGNLKLIPEHFPKGMFLVVDELYLFSNPSTQRSKDVAKISLFCSARMGLSGSLLPHKTLEAIYGQLHALGAHIYLAKNITQFRKRWMVRHKTPFGMEYRNAPGAFEKIKATLASIIDVYFPEETRTTIQILDVPKSSSQRVAIDTLKETFVHNGKAYKYALQVAQVVNGISNGWSLNAEGVLVTTKVPKMERLAALVQELEAANEKMVIWVAYHNDIKAILKELHWESRTNIAFFTSQQKFDEVGWKAGKYSICLATEAMGSSVNFFENVKYAIYYSIDYSLLNLQQSMARHQRKGSTHSGACYYFLQTKGTNDARAYYLVTESGKTEKDLVETLTQELFK